MQNQDNVSAGLMHTESQIDTSDASAAPNVQFGGVSGQPETRGTRGVDAPFGFKPSTDERPAFWAGPSPSPWHTGGLFGVGSGSSARQAQNITPAGPPENRGTRGMDALFGLKSSTDARPTFGAGHLPSPSHAAGLFRTGTSSFGTGIPPNPEPFGFGSSARPAQHSSLFGPPATGMSTGPGRCIGVFSTGDVTETKVPEKPETLIQAVNRNSVDALQDLLPLTTNPQELDEVMDIVASKGDAVMMKFLLGSARVNVDGASNDTPLFRAALGHHLEAMKLLLDYGADPKKRSRGLRSHGCIMAGITVQLSTPLHAVAGFDNVTGVHTRNAFPQIAEVQQRARECCQLLLDAGCDPNSRGYDENTPLHFCAASNLIVVAETLLKHGADPFPVNKAGLIPLALVRLSTGRDSIPMIHLFTQHGRKLDEPCGNDRKTPLHHQFQLRHDIDLSLLSPSVTDWNVANAKGETVLHQVMSWTPLPTYKLVSDLIKLGADVRCKDDAGIQPIHSIISRYAPKFLEGQGPIIRLLLGVGANLDEKDHEGRTPLHHLVNEVTMRTGNYGAVCDFVREFSPDVHAVDHDGNGVLHLALQKGPESFTICLWSPAILTGLVEFGADPRLINRYGENLMHILMRCNHVKAGNFPVNILQLLFDYGISSSSQDEDGNTPLHILCSTKLNSTMKNWLKDKGLELVLSSGDIDLLQTPNHAGMEPIHLAAANSKPLVSKLISRGVSISNQTLTNQNVLHFAASAREGNNVGLLIAESRAKKTLDSLLNQRDGNGSSPLHKACQSGSLESVLFLVEAGAEVDIQDNTGVTPLDLCRNIIDQVEQAGVEMWETQTTRSHLFYDVQIGCEPNPQPNDAGQMMEIICFLEQAMGQKPRLRGDYDLDIARLPFRHSLSRFTSVFLRGHYQPIQKLINSGIIIPLRTGGSGYDHKFEQKSSDLLSQLIMGGYVFLFDMIAGSLQDTHWSSGLDGAPPYILTAAMRTEPNMPILRLLVEKYGADLNAKGPVGNCIWGSLDYGALHMLARGHNWWQNGAVQYLLEQGADVNLKDGYGKTPLRLTVISFINGAPFSKEIMRTLLEGGADPNIADDRGWRPLDEEVDDAEVVDWLTRAGKGLS
ncbi:hypothetical protein N7508_006492 [Penicillium antarcticum]|uniref:uncharacterized protein n=1 Tax=Penicillium antarcticum TaxID=416450 RepID=UPI0023904B0D|nr:uncharacterized protein N7508_006492 [Penicillium antarcticum]KAJ5301629.1 hypothetical protein N7508_006492 [Penicillium antarcticum]